jgi:hypothetical protein
VKCGAEFRKRIETEGVVAYYASFANRRQKQDLLDSISYWLI